MTLEEYVIKRKREDGINEFDLEKRMENTRICVNYIFGFHPFITYYSKVNIDSQG